MLLSNIYLLVYHCLLYTVYRLPSIMVVHERFLRIIKYMKTVLNESIPTLIIQMVDKMFTEYGIMTLKDLALSNTEDVKDWFLLNSCTCISL